MKPIKMTREAEIELLKKFAEQFKKELDSFKFNMNESKFSMSLDMSQPAKEKVTILFTPTVYLKMQGLVEYYDTEVGWYGMVEKISDKLYRVYDVKVCKQYVNGGKVDTEDEDTLEFFNSLTDEEAEHMHFQAHSHVKMSTIASGIDLQNQADVIRNMGASGFYIFQIWNKHGDINTYLYDLDNNVFYDKKDVIIEIEDDDMTISDWVADTEMLVKEKKTTVYYPSLTQAKGSGKRKESSYLPDYWDGMNYNERWDF